MNSLATYHFLDWFGDHNSVYSLAEGEQDQTARYQTAEKYSVHAASLMVSVMPN